MPINNDDMDFDWLYDSGRPGASESDFDHFVPLGAGRKFRPEGDASPQPPKKKKKKTVASQDDSARKTPSSGAKKPSSGTKKPSSGAKKPSSGAKKPSSGAADASPARQRSVKKKKKKKTFGEELAAFFYLGAMAVSGGAKKIFGSRRGRLIFGAATLVIVLLLLAASVSALYNSNSIFADGSGKEADFAKTERMLTDEENRENVTYFLIVGVDKSTKLTDCIWLMCFDNKAHKINVLQIPRDTYVGEDSIAPHKINAVYESPKTVNWCGKCGKEATEDEIESGSHTVCGGKVEQRKRNNIDELIHCINSRLSLPVDYYLLFDFEGFEKVVDAMGGVDLYLEEELKIYPNKTDYETLHAGQNHLDGATALTFMRNRKTYAEGDLGRVKAQRKLIKAMMEKVEKMSLTDMLNILMAAKGSFKTDMSLKDMRSFLAPLKKCDADALYMFELPGENYWKKGRPSYYICDEEKTAEAFNEYMLPYGRKMTAYNISFPEPNF